MCCFLIQESKIVVLMNDSWLCRWADPNRICNMIGCQSTWKSGEKKLLKFQLNIFPIQMTHPFFFPTQKGEQKHLDWIFVSLKDVFAWQAEFSWVKSALKKPPAVEVSA